MTSSEIIAALKIHGSFPTSNDLFSNSDFLVLINHQMQSDLYPMMLKLNEEHFLRSQDFAISQGARYRIPTRAIGSKLRDVKKIDANGDYISIARIFEEDRPSKPSGYYIYRNQVELSEDFNSGILRLTYFARPNKIVLTTECAQITSIDTANNQVVVSSVPSDFSTNMLCDFVQNTNPFDGLEIDQVLTGISGTTLTFATLPDDLEVGDWVCAANESPVPMLPEELHFVLVQSALCKALSSKKDKAYELEMGTLMRMKEDVTNMLDPRVENNSNKVRTGKLLGYFSQLR